MGSGEDKIEPPPQGLALGKGHTQTAGAAWQLLNRLTGEGGMLPGLSEESGALETD